MYTIICSKYYNLTGQHESGYSGQTTQRNSLLDNGQYSLTQEPLLHQLHHVTRTVTILPTYHVKRYDKKIHNR
eukprot:5792918-Amphidinium_carterae.1